MNLRVKSGLFSLLVPAFVFLAPPSTWAALSCEQVIRSTQASSWQADLELVQSTYDSRIRQPFALRPSRRSQDHQDQYEIPTHPSAYTSTRYIISRRPQGRIPKDAFVIPNVEFGYSLSDGFRRLGRANYVVISKEGKVLEIGGGSADLLTEMQSHIFGRKMNPQVLRKIEEINTRIIAELRANPKAQEKLAAFAKKRGWPKGIAEEAQLSYFSEETFPIFQWAQANGYSNKQLRDAGWLLMKFNPVGEPVYQVNYSNSIKIPFFSDSQQTGIPIWRTRTLEDREDGKKYLGWQNDRSIGRDFEVSEALYNGWKLNSVKGKPLVITEGEFKCMVATKESGILNVGIPGITQFDARIARSIVGAQPSEIIVILDRDPKGKGLMRFDGITDSQRAAYSIAKQLEQAGAKNVKVGILPDAFDGSKVGVDDLILGKGVEPYLQTVQSAMSPATYAKTIGLDPVLHEMNQKWRMIDKALDDYRQAQQRGGQPVDPQVIERLTQEMKATRAATNNYLARNFQGTRSINQPFYLYPSLRQDPRQIAAPDVVAITSKGQQVPRSIFAKDVLLLDFVPSDAPTSSCRPGPCLKFDMTESQIRDALSAKGSPEVAKILERGVRILEESGFKPASAADWISLFMAGKLAHEFPLDEYRFEFNVNFGDSGVVPVVIYRESTGSAVAMGRLRMNRQDLNQNIDLFNRVGQQLRP